MGTVLDKVKTTAGQPASQLSNMDRDSQLQMVRRLDWRFLLPDPRLSHVAYWGPTQNSLFQALEQFSDSLTILSHCEKYSTKQVEVERKPEQSFDCIVVHSPDQNDLQNVAQFLSPHGYLYWEIERVVRFVSLRHFRQSGILRHFREYTTFLKDTGFVDIHVHWHRPDFERCLEIIPLDKPDALHYVFLRKSGSFPSQILLRAGKLLVTTNLLAPLVSSFSIVARKE